VHLPTGLITSLSEEVFFARLRLQQNNHEIDVDSRPSDAIALAVRFECRIFVSAEVLDRAGVIHEHDKDEERCPRRRSMKAAWPSFATSSTAWTVQTCRTSPAHPAGEAPAAERLLFRLTVAFRHRAHIRSCRLCRELTELIVAKARRESRGGRP
jgi:hypothetical protein